MTKGTELGILQGAEVIDDLTEETGRKETERMLRPEEKEAVEKIMSGLPEDLDEEQRSKVRGLLSKHRSIISTGKHDIGRTDLVEYHIDTGDHKPIRQPLRRHPFQHLNWIDEEVDEMQRHGIVEPAASPWASNVVLVKKKDGSLRFCAVSYTHLTLPTNREV